MAAICVSTRHPWPQGSQADASDYAEFICFINILGIFIFHPVISGYHKAKFPGVVVFSEIYQGGYDRNEHWVDAIHTKMHCPTGIVHHAQGDWHF
jgi:hypothetical protein